MADAPGSSRPAEPLRVLLVEDNPGDARLFEEHLTESDLEAGLTWKEDLEEGLERLAEAAPDVLVLDLGLPDSEGTGAVRRCREAAPSVPVVVLTGQKGQEVARRVQEAGATEYLQKGELMPALLARTLRWAVRAKAMEERLGCQSAWIESTFGISREAAEGEDIQTLLVPPEEKNRADSIRQRLLAGDPVDREVRRKAADGLRADGKSFPSPSTRLLHGPQGRWHGNWAVGRGDQRSRRYADASSATRFAHMAICPHCK